MSKRTIAALVGALALAGCRMEDMTGMGGMQGMEMRSMALLPAMRAHLDSLAAMPAEAVAAMLPAHRMVVSEMWDAMSADMGMMGITADSDWAKLVASLRRHLAELPQLSAEAFRSRLHEHLRRMRTLMDMHEAMMARRMKC